jgi:hypothetical protein
MMLADSFTVARSEVLAVVLLKIHTLWDVMQCRLVSIYRRFEGLSCHAVFCLTLKMKLPEDLNLYVVLVCRFNSCGSYKCGIFILIQQSIKD